MSEETRPESQTEASDAAHAGAQAKDEGADLALELAAVRVENTRLREQVKARDEQLEKNEKTLREYIASYRQATQEFESIKERLRRDVDAQVDRARGKFLLGLLEVLDNLDRSLSAPAPEDARGKALLDGVRMVREQFVQRLKENQVERLEVQGKPFDPELHEALTTTPAPEASKHNTVAYEARAGYTLNGKLLRAAQVVVFTS